MSTVAGGYAGVLDHLAEPLDVLGSERRLLSQVPVQRRTDGDPGALERTPQLRALDALAQARSVERTPGPCRTSARVAHLQRDRVRRIRTR
jgi:hypothetical protein